MAAFSGELEFRAQVLVILDHLPACAPGLQHLLLAAYGALADLELGRQGNLEALGAVISACRLLRSVNICLQDGAESKATVNFQPPAASKQVHCSHVVNLISCASESMQLSITFTCRATDAAGAFPALGRCACISAAPPISGHS